jgi:predicted DNA-binding WGR domain protein
VHLVALRMLQAREEIKRRQGAGPPRSTIQVETRTYTKRHEKHEEVHQLSLDRRRLKMRWGRRDAPLRVQSLTFNTVEAAREAYFSRVDELESRGYLDATAG